MIDYSKTVFAKGLVCYNMNTHFKCIVIDGNQGDENDRCSRVIEKSIDGIIIHTPPNRALIPTGECFDIKPLERALYISHYEYQKVFGGSNNENNG